MKTKLILGLSTVALAFTPMAKKVDLQFNLEKGKTYSQKTVMMTETKQTIMGNEQVVKQSAIAETKMELKEGGKNANTYSIWYDSIQMAIEQGGTAQEFTSDTAALAQVDPMSTIFSSMVDKKFEANIDLKGNIQEVTGLEEIVTDATSSLGEQASLVAEQISAGFGDSGLAKNLEMLTAIMPETAVKVGATWSNEQFTSSGLPLIMTNTFTLKSIKEGVAVINVEADMSVDPENSTTEIQGMAASFFLEGTRTGSFQMEVSTGFVTSAEMDDEIVGSITIEANNQVPEGMTIPLEMKTKTTVSSY